MSTYRTRVSLVAALMLCALAPALAWQQPVLTIGPTAPGGIATDGVLAPQEWGDAPGTPLFCDYQSGRAAAVQTRVQAAWDDRALHLGIRCDEPRIADLKATMAQRDAPLWGEEGVEVFLKPPTGETYYHFVVSPLGTLYDAKAQDGSWNCDASAAAQKQAETWTCELAIPWADIGGPPRPGDTWTANFARGRKVGGEQLTCWSVTGGSFHNPQAFGKLVFAARPAGLSSMSLGDLLPGVNHLAFRTAAPGAPVTVRISATTPRRVLAEKVVEAGQTADLAYELAPDDLRAPLELSVLDAAGATTALQAFSTDAPLAPPSADLADVLAKLKAILADSQVEALTKLRDSGVAALANLDTALAAARQAGRTLTRPEWARLAADLTEFQGECLRPLVWTSAPGAAKPLEGPAGETSVDIAMAVNERESCALYLKAPLLTSGLRLQARLGDLSPLATTPGLDARALKQRVNLFEAVPVPLRTGGTVADPLSPVPISGLFQLAPGETRELWVRVDSDGLAPGYYSGSLTIAPLDPRLGVRPVSVPLRIRVWGITLPTQTPVAIYVSDYTRSATSPEHLTDLLAHHVTVLNANGLPTPNGDGHADLTGLGKYLELVKGKGQLFLEVWFMRDTGWQPRYATWVREVADEMVRLGYGYNDWILQIYDETLCDQFLECCKQIKAVEPRIRIFSDYMGTPEQIAAFAPYVDIWCPFWADLNKQGGACLKAMQDTGKPIWTYDCGGTKSTPVGRYRALPWVAWRHKLDGVYEWCYPGSEWDETPIADFNYGHVYEGYRGEPITSKRWEAFSDGIEDLMLLRQYEAKLGEARTPADDQLIAAAQAFGDQGGGDPAAMADVRTQIAHRLLELQGTPVTRDFPRVSFPRWQVRLAGDGKGVSQLEPGAHGDPGDLALVLRAETERSWAFAAQPLQATQGQRVRLSVWVKGKGSLRVGICEGFSFGGDPSGHHISERIVSLGDEWQQVTVEHVVGASPVEAFIGFDYGNAGAMGALSDVVVEVAGP